MWPQAYKDPPFTVCWQELAQFSYSNKTHIEFMTAAQRGAFVTFLFLSYVQSERCVYGTISDPNRAAASVGSLRISSRGPSSTQCLKTRSEISYLSLSLSALWWSDFVKLCLCCFMWRSVFTFSTSFINLTSCFSHVCVVVDHCESSSLYDPGQRFLWFTFILKDLDFSFICLSLDEEVRRNIS